MVSRRGMLTVMGSIVTATLGGAAIESRIARSAGTEGTGGTDREVAPPAGEHGVVVAPVDLPVDAPLDRAARQAADRSRRTDR